LPNRISRNFKFVVSLANANLKLTDLQNRSAAFSTAFSPPFTLEIAQASRLPKSVCERCAAFLDDESLLI
jgi:hypothetical protein